MAISTSDYAISPEQLAALAKPTTEAGTLPPECYWDPDIYEREVTQIFFKEWLCVGRVEDLPNPGDYMTTTIASEPIVVVRDGEGTIRAYLNVCRHRGCQVIAGSGSTKTFRCPYHGWMYALTGELRGTPDFKETKNFSKREYPLFSVQAEVWEGFILINLDPDAGPFQEVVEDVTNWGGEKYRMGEMVTTHGWEYHLECNWKAYVENYIEEYHIPWVHDATFQPVAPMKQWIEFPDITENQWLLMVGQVPGLTFSDSGDALFPVSPELADLPPKYDGMPIWLVNPTMMVIPAVDCMVYYVAFPEGPEKCRIMLRMCIPAEAAGAYHAGDADAVAAADEYARNTEAFILEDNKICQQQQVGLRSRHAAPGRFCKHEGLLRMFDKWVADKAYGPLVADGENGAGGGRGNVG